MGDLEEFFRRDQKIHGELLGGKDAHLLVRRVFYWRLETPKASKALLDLRYFGKKTVVVAFSQPGHFTFSEDFLYAFNLLCGNFDLHPNKTACFERFLEKRIHCHRQKYIQFRLVGDIVSREFLSGEDFDRLITRLNQNNGY